MHTGHFQNNTMVSCTVFGPKSGDSYFCVIIAYLYSCNTYTLYFFKHDFGIASNAEGCCSLVCLCKVHAFSKPMAEWILRAILDLCSVYIMNCNREKVVIDDMPGNVSHYLSLVGNVLFRYVLLAIFDMKGTYLFRNPMACTPVTLLG